MLILTNENKSYNLDRVPNEVEDIRYCVLDLSDPDYIDYYFRPLIFLESFFSPAVVLEIGPYTTQVPLDWSILVCDSDYSDIELMPLTSLNDRGFCSIVYNPLKHMVPVPYEVNIVNVYADVKWYLPKLKTGTVLVTPLENNTEPMCSLFVREKTKIPDQIDIASLFE